MARKRIIAFHGKYDRPGKKDVTYAFRPECDRFIDTMGGHRNKIFVIDNKKKFADRGRAVIEGCNEASEDPRTFDCVAFFCHGWRNGMEFGFTRRNAKSLAAAIWKATKKTNVVVPLYLCSTGSGRNHGAISFADTLRDELCKAGAVNCRVMAHSAVKHTTKNPDALFFDGMGSPVGGTGGYPVVAVGSTIRRRWVAALRNTDLRFRFPFMRLGAIHNELLKG